MTLNRIKEIAVEIFTILTDDRASVEYFQKRVRRTHAYSDHFTPEMIEGGGHSTPVRGDLRLLN